MTTSLTDAKQLERDFLESRPGYRRVPPGTFVEFAVQPPPRFLDHVSEYRGPDRDEVVSQPYGLEDENLAAAIEFGHQHGWRVGVYAGSWHYPGRTILLCFFRRRSPRTEGRVSGRVAPGRPAARRKSHGC